MTMMKDYCGSKEYYRSLKLCLDAAEEGETIHYKDIAALIPGVPKAGNHMSKQTASMTGSISTAMDEHDHPMLSAVVVRVSQKGPGKGFYKLADQLGNLPKDHEKMTDTEKLSFWEDELERVHDYWQ